MKTLVVAILAACTALLFIWIEKGDTSKLWMYVLGAVLVFFLYLAARVYWSKRRRKARARREELSYEAYYKQFTDGEGEFPYMKGN
jgi:hypothetical protein